MSIALFSYVYYFIYVYCLIYLCTLILQSCHVYSKKVGTTEDMRKIKMVHQKPHSYYD